MNPIAALGGLLLALAVIALIAAFTWRPSPSVARPPSRLANVATRAWRFRIRLGAAFVLGTVVLAFTGWVVAAATVAASAVILPSVLSARPAQRAIARLDAIEQWTRKISDLLKAGRGLEEALTLSARSAPEALREETEELARRLRARNPQMTTEKAIRLWADAVDDPIGDRIAGALLIAARERGGNVGEVLTKLAGIVGRDVAARREIEASRAEHRTTLRWLLLITAGFSCFVAANPSYSEPYDSPLGQAVLAVVAALYAAGLGWIRRLAAPPRHQRILVSSGDTQ